LEKELGIALLNRSRLPVALTRAGELYLKYLEKCSVLEKEFASELEMLKQECRYSLSIGIPMQITPYLFQGPMRDFMRNYSSVHMSISESTSSITSENKLLSRDVDIAYIHTVSLNSSLFRYYLLRKERVLLVCNKSHPLVRNMESSINSPLIIEPELLSSEVFLLLREEYRLFHVAMDIMKKHDISARKIITLGNLEAILNFISSGEDGGVTFMADFILHDYRNADKLAYLAFADGVQEWYFSLAVTKDQAVSTWAEVFINFNEDYFKKH